jgi:hypothetical protein
LFRSTEAPPSTRALEEAVKLAQLTSGRLRLLHVSDVLTFATGFETYALYKADVLPTMKRAGEHVLDDGPCALPISKMVQPSQEGGSRHEPAS